MTNDIKFWNDGYSVVITCIRSNGLPLAVNYGLEQKRVTCIESGHGPLVGHTAYTAKDDSRYRPLDRLSVLTLTGKAPDHWVKYIEDEIKR